jgi:putative peptidoglycan lipid II flippase
MAETPQDLPDRTSPERVAGPSLSRATAVMSAGTLASRATGFVRIAVMAWAIGATESKLADTYNLANSMPNIVYQLVLGEILATIFVPVFVEYITTRNRDEAWTLASSVLNIAIIVGTAFACVTVLIAPWLIKIYTFNVHPIGLRHQQEVTGTFFLRLFMPQMVFYATGAVLTGLLNAYRKFAVPMFAPVLNNLIVIATFALFRFQHHGRAPQLNQLTAGDKWLLGGGTTLGVVAMTMVLWPFVRRLPGRYRPRAMQWRHPAIRHVGNLAKYSFGYVIVNQIGLWLVYALANGAHGVLDKGGGVTAYQYSWILYQLPYGIFAVSVMTYIVREVSEHHVRGDMDAVQRDISLGLRTTALVVLPAAAGFVALSRPLIRLLLQHGAFTAASTALTADTFAWMAIGLGAYAAFQQMMRAFYAMQDTKTPWLVNIGATGANIVTAIPLYHAMGVPGLGLSHAISYLVGAVYGGWVLRRRIGGLDGARLASSHLRIGAAAIVTGVVAWVVARATGSVFDVTTAMGQLLHVLCAVAAGAVAYVVCARAFGVEEVRPLIAMLRRRFAGRTA